MIKLYILNKVGFPVAGRSMRNCFKSTIGSNLSLSMGNKYSLKETNTQQSGHMGQNLSN